jgi:colanic acid biosynthesis glycosyl transferase WcaI
VKILVVSQYFWPESFRINDLVLGLKERGHEVTVLTGKPNYPTGVLFPGYGFFSRSKGVFQDIPVYRVPLIPRGKAQSWRLALNYLSFVFFASVFGPFLCRGRFELIFVYEPSPITVCLPAIVLKWLKQAPLILWVQDLWPESISATGAIQSPLILNCISKLVGWIYRRCDLILVQSQAFIPSVVARRGRGDQVRYFPNWAETLYQVSLTPPESLPQEARPGKFNLMYAGNIGTAQSFETILAAAQKLAAYPEIHWVIVGDGRRGHWLEEQVQALGLKERVHLLGQKPVETMPDYFACADAMLVTLRRDPIFALTVPSKLQSYLACGRPVIAAVDGETARIVKEAGAGLASPAEDGEALAQAVLRLYRMTAEEREIMRARGKDYFDANFHREYLLPLLETWMQELAQSRTCAS